MSAVVVEGLRKSYRGRVALGGVSLSVEEGEIYGLVGPDGAGKSTLMKVLSGILSFDEGRVSVLGRDVGKEPEEVKKLISFMPQGIGQNLYMDLTVEENVDFFARLRGLSPQEASPLKERLLEATGLAPFRGRLAKNLSGGMQQKLGICCSLVSRPSLLMLDEPTTGVDPVSRRHLWDLLYGFMKEGVTMLVSTSYTDEAERFHRFSFMYRGEVLRTVDTEEMVASGEDADTLFRKLLPPQDGSFSLPFEGTVDGGGVAVEGLTKRFGDFVAVEDVSFEVEPGEIFGLLGPNGAGKTTTIKMMVGLLKPTSGRVRGVPKGRLGYMSQRFSLYKDLTVEENIDYYGAVYGIGGKELERRKAWILEISGLSGMRGELVAGIPLGFKQRLALGCSFIHFPSVLFLDEPTSGVDPAAREVFWRIIRSLSAELGVTVMVTTHHLLEAHYCNRLALMNGGRVVALGTPRELIEGCTRAQGEAFEVVCPDAVALRDEFISRGLFCYVWGKRLKVWDRLDANTLSRIVEDACPGARVVPSRVTMEDVFIFYSRDGDAGLAGGA